MNLIRTLALHSLTRKTSMLSKMRFQPFAKQCTFVEFSDNSEFKQFLETGVQKKKVKRKLTDEEIGAYVKNLVIPENELGIKYSRSSGPGGQHVNRTESKATVTFNILKSSVLQDDAKRVLVECLGNKLTKNGELMVSCQESREQKRNLDTAVNNLKRMIAENIGSEIIEDVELLKEEAESKNLRLDYKKKRSDIKKMRNNKFDF